MASDIGATNTVETAPLPLLSSLREIARTPPPGLLSSGSIVFGLSLGQAMLTLSIPCYSLLVYDKVLQTRSAPTLFVLFLLIAMVIVLVGVVEACRADVLARSSAKLQFWLQQHETGRRVLIPHGNEILQFLAGRSAICLCDLASSIVSIAMLWLLSEYLAVLALIACALTLLASWTVAAATVRSTSQAGIYARRRLAGVDPTTSPQSTLLRAKALTSARSKAIFDESLLVGLRNGRYRTWAVAYRDGARTFAYVLVLTAAALLVIRSDLQPGLVMAATLLFTRIVGAFDAAFFRGQRFSEVAAAACALAEVARKHAEPFVVPEPPRAELQFQCVTFALPQVNHRTDSAAVIRDADLTLNPGRLVLVSGPPSSGKSLLAGIAAGVISPTNGRILLDGWNLEDLTLSDISKWISYLPQDMTLPEGTIAEIISCGRLDLKEKIVTAAVMANAHDEVCLLPGNYNRWVGRTVSPLPFGLRRKLCIARGLFEPRKVIVIDDPTHGLANDDRAHIVRSLSSLRDSGHAVLVCTSDNALASISDEVYQIMDGVLVNVMPSRASVRHISAIVGVGAGAGA